MHTQSTYIKTTFPFFDGILWAAITKFILGESDKSASLFDDLLHISNNAQTALVICNDFWSTSKKQA